MRNGKYVLIAGSLVILFAVGVLLIGYGLEIGPVKTTVDNALGVTKGAIETTGEAITTKEAITTPYERTTSDTAISEGAISGGAITAEGVSSAAVSETPSIGKMQSQTSYSSLYPNMCVAAPESRTVVQNTIFLTFDDGPGAGTESILDTLAAHNAKATFFVVGNRIGDDTAPLLQRMVNEGHTIAVHTTCHNYNTIYASVEAYLKDFNTTFEKIHDYTGSYPRIFRFPGGSINSFNKGVYKDIIAEMSNRGFTYYDWNISAGDATNGATEQTIYASSVLGLKYKDSNRNAILLMHDTSLLSAAQLDAIMTTYEENGFDFAALSPSIKPVKM